MQNESLIFNLFSISSLFSFRNTYIADIISICNLNQVNIWLFKTGHKVTNNMHDFINILKKTLIIKIVFRI